MAHLRAFKHSFHTQFLLLGAFEFAILTGSVFIGAWLRGADAETFAGLLPGALTFSVVMILTTIAMGVYPAHLREGFTGMTLRTAVGYFLLGSIALSVLYYALPGLSLGRGTLATSALTGFVAVAALRWLLVSLIEDPRLKKTVLVLGTGTIAERIATRLRRRSDQRGFVIHGYALVPEQDDQVSQHGARVFDVADFNYTDYCINNHVQEIVVALDTPPSGRVLDGLMEARLSGINIIQTIEFFEREVGKIEVDLLSPDWIAFSDGFKYSPIRAWSERILDLAASITLLILATPIMLVAAAVIWLESGGPIFYRQERVGLNGQTYWLTKFRSMVTDAEKDGAKWAQANDPRVTRVGRFLRSTRIDELPQVFNVIAGHMSFVGPRPERPEFVSMLEKEIPYFKERHRVKPGITGWAQLCYPYGASVEDSRQKLQYDLYYIKNHSVLLDLIIMIQTVEVVLVGEGAR